MKFCNGPQQFLELLEHFNLAARIKARDVHPYKGIESTSLPA